MENKIYPLKLSSVFKEIMWGGDSLKTIYNKKCDYEKLAESWELTVRNDGMSIIENGIYSNKTLKEYLMCDTFPLLIKFIDARDNLSIQVHPDNEYAMKNEGECGKTEMWYIVEAENDAEIVYNLKDDFSKEAFIEALNNETIENLLNRVKVKKGEVYFIPAGMVHAIGRGIVIAEIQQNANITYRVYDYNRKQKDGSPRQLHVTQALDVIKNFTKKDIDNLRFSNLTVKKDSNLLASCEYFKVFKYDIVKNMKLNADEKSFHSILCLDGSGCIIHNNEKYNIQKGDSYFIPATMGEYELLAQDKTLSIILSSI